MKKERWRVERSRLTEIEKGAWQKRVKKERWRVDRSKLTKMASPRGGPRDSEA